MRLPSLTEQELLLMWTQLLVIVAVARALGLAMRRIGQPPVVGELLAGVLLGPSVLAKIWPVAGEYLIPDKLEAAGPINAIGWIGVAFLLVLTGFETDLKIVRRLGRPAALVALGGLLLPFAVGLGLGLVAPDSFRGDEGTRAAFVLFIGVALSISSLPVIAKILDELGLMRRNFAQVTIAVGMVNDLIGWLALGIIAALGRSSELSLSTVLIPIVAITAILIGAFTVGQRVIDYLLLHLRRRESSGVDAMTVTLVVTFAFAALTQYAKSDAVLGAYIAGILIGRSRYFQERIGRQLESVTLAVFAPVFFATAGLRMDLGSLADATALTWTAIILVAAVVTKVVGAYVGARAGGLVAREGLALGVGLNCRGAVEVVIATVGLTIGVLSPTAYTAIVLMAILTSMMAPPLLRLVVRGWRGTPAEQERLEREAAMERNLLIRPGRLLLPSRGGPSSVTAAHVLHATWPEDIGVTVLSVADDDGHTPELNQVLAVFDGRDVDVRNPTGETLDEILEESKLGYSAIGVGARDTFSEGTVLSPVVDNVLAHIPLPMVIVRRSRDVNGDEPSAPRFRRALVPVSGTPSSRTGQELAYALAKSMGTEVVLTHVETRPVSGSDGDDEPDDFSASGKLAQTTATGGILEQAVTHAGEHDVRAHTSVRTGTATSEEILRDAAEHEADVIVMGTTVRRLEDRSFLGHTVEHVLDRADATVLVVATPDALLAEGIADRHD